ncbi:MAG: hypothetical protein WCJ35_20855 [Planctomycetota bacterium]
MNTLIAIDPGKSGGIAWTMQDSLTNGCPMPETEGDVLDRLRELAIDHHTAYVEEVGGYCGAGQPGSAMFTFGRGFGFILGCLMSMGVSVVLVKPQKWQKHFSLGTAREAGSKTDWKNKLKAEAQRRYPTLDVTLKTADALLILDYARNQQPKL